MGVDLCLLPIKYDRENSFSSYTLIELNRNYELQDAIRALPTKECPENFYSHRGRVPDGQYKGESTFGPTATDPYGDRIKYVLAGDMKKIRKRGIEWSAENSAAFAYIKELPDDYKIALYWH